MEVSCTVLLVCMEEKGENYERSIYVVNLRNICMYTWYTDRFVVFRKENGCWNTTRTMHLGSKRSRWFCVMGSFFEPRGLGTCFFLLVTFFMLWDRWCPIQAVNDFGRNPRRVDYQTVHKRVSLFQDYIAVLSTISRLLDAQNLLWFLKNWVWKIDFRMIYTLGSWID